MNQSDFKKTRKGESISPAFFAPNNNSNNPEVIIRPAFDPFHPSSKDVHRLQLLRSSYWFPVLKMGVILNGHGLNKG